jgi:uncharacterized damage-inducible protein DinB
MYDQTRTTFELLASIPAAKHDYRYAPEKWSVREVVQHLADTERVMSYRALTALRGDSESALPGFDENVFARFAEVGDRTMEDLLEEFRAIRTATHKLLERVSPDTEARTTFANGYHTTARAIAYMILGHVIHHQVILQERYL